LACEPGNLSYFTGLRDAYLRMGRLDDAIRTVRDALDAAHSSGRISVAMHLEDDLRKLNDIKTHRVVH
jgi:hypothetical protein